MIHHPTLAETGELEIAQRQALNEARKAANLLGNSDDHGTMEIVRVAVETYLAAMRRQWNPGPIQIGEGDYITVQAAGSDLRRDVVHERVKSGPELFLFLPRG